MLWHYMESTGTKGYSRRELKAMLRPLSLEAIQVDTVITAADYLSASAFRPLNWIYRLAIALAGYHYPWLPSDYVAREGAPDRPTTLAPRTRGPKDILFTGNPLGFFHCISARKAP